MKIATRIAAFLVSLAWTSGCGLNTQGLGGEEDHVPDIVPDEIEPDGFEADTAEVTEEDAAEETDDEATREDVSDAFDVERTDDFAETGDEGGEEDGETVDPCAPPDIPTTGLWLFYCLTEDRLTTMSLYRWVRRDSLPNTPWGIEPGCIASDTRTLWCELHLARSGTVIFNVEMLFAWSCSHVGTPFMHGTPRVWVDGTETPLGVVWNGFPGDGCNHTFELPAPP